MRSKKLRTGGKQKDFIVKFETWCTQAVKHPRVSIVLPLLIVFLFSYPFLRTLHDPRDAFLTAKYDNYISKMEVVDVNDPESFEPDFALNLLQVWVKPVKETNILTKKTLLESLAFQERFSKGVRGVATISSAFRVWNHSLENLKNDPSPLHTINSQVLRIPRYSLFGTWKINGILISATGFVISLLVNKENFPNLTSSLNKNIKQLNEISNITGFHILGDVNEAEFEQSNEILKYSMVSSSNWDNGIFLILTSSLVAYFIFFTHKLKNSVKSPFGCSIAVIVQLILVIVSSSTITNFWFKNSNDNLPFHLLYLPIIFVLINNDLKVIKDVSGSVLNANMLSKQADGQSRKIVSEAYDDLQEKDFISNIAESHYMCTKILGLLSLLIIFVVPFSRKATCFLLTSLWIGHFLQCGFLTAVLSLDFRRFDTDNGLEVSESKNEIFLDQDIKLIPDKKGLLERWCSFNYLCSIRCSMLFCLIYIICFNRRFALTRTSTSFFYKLLKLKLSSLIPPKRPMPSAIFDHHLVADLIFDPTFINSSKGKIELLLSFVQPLFVLKGAHAENLNEEQIKSRFDNSSFISSYKIDLSYAFEFILLILLTISCTLLLLQKIIVKLDSISGFDSSTLHQRLNKEDLKRKEEKDANSITREASFGPEKSIDQFHIKELYNHGHTLDITSISESKSPFVVSVGLDYKVLVWSPLVKPIPPPTSIPLHRKFWPLSKVIISNDGYHVAFFSEHGNITTWSRRHMKFMWELEMKQNPLKNNALPLEAFFRKITSPSSNRTRSQATVLKQASKNNRLSVNSEDFITMTSVGGIDASYEQIRNNLNNDDELEELVFLTAAGLIYSIDIKGKIRVDNATSSEHTLKSCKKLSSPRVNDRLVICDEIGDLYVSTVVNNKWRSRKLSVNYRNVIVPPEKSCKIQSTNPTANTIPREILETDNTIELVSFVGMLLRVIGTNAELIDAQTGALIRVIPIGHFIPNSLQVFHDTPTHCKFCGSASVASFSIAYTDADISRVVLHTFQLESKTKTSICLRVERDAREIRCLGMESAVDTIHYFYNVENWCVTDNNKLIGIRRIPENIIDKIGTTSMSMNTPDEPMSLQNRKHKAINHSVPDSDSFKIHNIWEGWTISANGTVMLHKIPVGVNGLMVNKLGPLVRFGSKAMIVGFANIMNMFYVGHEDMLFSTENDNVNREESSLKFVNKRRNRFSNRKVSINYSTY